jgi:hypothetical protein
MSRQPERRHCVKRYAAMRPCTVVGIVP